MRWDEFVEEATASIGSRRLARDVRREMRDHLETTAEALEADGLGRDAAEEEALRRMGPVDVLREQYRLQYRPWAPVWPAAVAVAGGVATVVALGFQAPSAGIFLFVWSVLWSLVHVRSFREAWRRPWSVLAPGELRMRLEASRPCMTAGGVAALAIVLEPWAQQGIGALAALLAAVAAAGAWYVATLRVEARDGQEGPAAPFGAALATMVLVGAAGFVEALVGGGHRVAYVLLAAALYFTGTQVMGWLRRARHSAVVAERLPLLVEHSAS